MPCCFRGCSRLFRPRSSVCLMIPSYTRRSLPCKNCDTNISDKKAHCCWLNIFRRQPHTRVTFLHASILLGKIAVERRATKRTFLALTTQRLLDQRSQGVKACRRTGGRNTSKHMHSKGMIVLQNYGTRTKKQTRATRIC